MTRLQSQNALDIIRAVARSAPGPADLFRIRALWVFSGVSNIDGVASSNCVVPYFFALALVGDALGCCYSEEQPVPPAQLLLADARTASAPTHVWEIAILDGIMASQGSRPGQGVGATRSVTLEGSSTHKAEARTSLIIECLSRAAERRKVKLRSVLNIGVLGRLIRRLDQHGLEVSACDLDPSIVGTTIGRVSVRHGGEVSALIGGSDAVVLTAMAITNGSFDEILAACKLHNRPLVVYGQTGHAFAPVYLQCGVDAMVSESFPLYTVPGSTHVDLHESESTTV